MGILGHLLPLVCLGLMLFKVCSEPTEDKQALLDFGQNFPHSRKLNWDRKTPMCTNWTGVTCNGNQTKVISLRLPGVGFIGPVPPNTISRLLALETLSLRSNLISGAFPSELLKLGNLKTLYLQSNRLSSPLPMNFTLWKNITTINLSNNGFNGSIPSSISNLTHLTSLDLSNNFLSGEIPDFDLPSLVFLNLSNNNLTGFIPNSLRRFPSSAFSGNNLSSTPLTPPLPPVLPPIGKPSNKRSQRLSESAILGIILGGCILLFMGIAAYILVCCSNKESANGSPPVAVAKAKAKEKTSQKRVPKKYEENEGITFFEAEGSNLAFDLEDLLGASAELLGKGIFGITYRVALEDSSMVVVKRLKGVTVGKRDFEQQMKTLGSIKHQNVAGLRAYYYSSDEKLMVYDYFNSGSISKLLYGKRGEGRIPLTWETRLKIAIGGARGIAHIHTQNGGKMVHGNIKASNIFLNSEQLGCVSEQGLATIVTPLVPTVTRSSAGYRAPEVTDRHKATQASDVYSFGVFLLELLTAKSPQEEGTPLVRWVNSVVREEWTSEVFDLELLRYPNVEPEMVQLLQLGITCTLRVPDRRPSIVDVVRIIGEIQTGRSGGSTPSSAYNVVGIGSSSASAPQ